MRTILLAFLATAAAAPQDTVKFTATTRMVVLNVTVRDRSGAPVVGLTKDDFEVLEDGKRQSISVFEFQRLAGVVPEAPAAPPPSSPRRNAITSAAPGTVRYRDRRLLVLFFDFSSMPAEDQSRAQRGALKFISDRMLPEDVVAIMSFGARLRVEQDFTADRDVLAGTIRGFRIGETSDLTAPAPDSDTAAEDNAAFSADDAEFNLFNTDRKLTALENAARMLAALPEKKALIYFSSGVGKTGIENISQVRATVNAAVRANVAFYPVDARGLSALPPGGDASRGGPKGTGLFTGKTQFGMADAFRAQQQTLSTLAADTGGKALVDSNDLSAGVALAQRDLASYYILGYYTSNPAEDGRFRRVQVRLAHRKDARLDFRPGYFAPKRFERMSGSDRERQLEDALLLGDPVTELPLALEVDYFRISPGRYFAPVSVRAPRSLIPLARKGAEEYTVFDFIGQVRDPRGKLVAGVRDSIRVKLDEDGAARSSRGHFQYETGFTLAPGDYRLKFVVRENQTGRMGTFETGFHVPGAEGWVHLSSVVWSGQHEPVAAAVGRADGNDKRMAAHPLVREGQKIVPSITRVFRRDQTLYAYAELYDPSRDGTEDSPSVAASVGCYGGGQLAAESQPVATRRLLSGRPGAVGIELALPLSSLAPGNYVCQYNVMDQVAQSFAQRRVPVVILP